MAGVTTAPDQRPWPGITGLPCWLCSWAWYQGVFQLKIINRSCAFQGHLLP
jgi:hypothetical protein